MARVFPSVGRYDGPSRVADTQKVTVSSTALAFGTGSDFQIDSQNIEDISPDIVGAIIEVDDANPIRIAFGEAPTATTGISLDQGDVIAIWGAGNVRGTQIIREGGADSVVEIIFMQG